MWRFGFLLAIIGLGISAQAVASAIDAKSLNNFIVMLQPGRSTQASVFAELGQPGSRFDRPNGEHDLTFDNLYERDARHYSCVMTFDGANLYVAGACHEYGD